MGRVTIVVGDNLIIGDNVQMERALLIVKNNLRIGTNCRIKGIVAAGGEITIGVNFSLQRREDVLEPYFAAMYLEWNIKITLPMAMVIFIFIISKLF